MKRLLMIVPALALLGGVQAMAADAPADPVVETTETAIPPIVDPIDDVPYIIHDAGTFPTAPPTTSDGVPYVIHDAVTTPQHDQCWSDAGGVNDLLESGQFVIYGVDDSRRWGTHSIGGMRCGPADLPFPEPAPAPVAAAAVPQYDATGATCD